MDLSNSKLFQELKNSIDLNDNGEEIIRAMSTDSLQKMHNSLSGLSGVDTQYNDSKIHAQLIETELEKRGVAFTPISWK